MMEVAKSSVHDQAWYSYTVPCFDGPYMEREVIVPDSLAYRSDVVVCVFPKPKPNAYGLPVLAVSPPLKSEENVRQLYSVYGPSRAYYWLRHLPSGKVLEWIDPDSLEVV